MLDLLVVRIEPAHDLPIPDAQLVRDHDAVMTVQDVPVVIDLDWHEHTSLRDVLAERMEHLIGRSICRGHDRAIDTSATWYSA